MLLNFLGSSNAQKTLRSTSSQTRKFFFYPEESRFELNCPHCPAPLSLKISGFQHFEEQIPNLTKVLRKLATTFSQVDVLLIRGDNATSDTDITEWMPLFRLFPAVKALLLSGGMAVLIASVLENIPEEMVTDVFPALRLILIVECEDEEEDEEEIGSIERFLSLRQRFGCPVAIFDMEGELVEAGAEAVGELR